LPKIWCQNLLLKNTVVKNLLQDCHCSGQRHAQPTVLIATAPRRRQLVIVEMTGYSF